VRKTVAKRIRRSVGIVDTPLVPERGNVTHRRLVSAYRRAKRDYREGKQ
jgi:hypothetical protein